MPFFSQSPKRVGSGPSLPPSSVGISGMFCFFFRSAASDKARLAASSKRFSFSVLSGVIFKPIYCVLSLTQLAQIRNFMLWLLRILSGISLTS